QEHVSWLRRGGESGAAPDERAQTPSELTFEYLPLPPNALLRVGAGWPDDDRSAPDVMLIVDDGSQRHELEPLPDSAGSAAQSGWRVAFAAPASVAEAPEASFALRVGG